MASYKIRTAGNCPAVFFYYQVSVHNRGDAYSILESDAKGRCRYGCCRRNYSSLPQQKLESVAEIAAATIAAGGTILLCGNEN